MQRTTVDKQPFKPLTVQLAALRHHGPSHFIPSSHGHRSPGLAMQNLSVPSSTIAGTTAKVTWKTTERDAPNNVTHFTLFLMGKNGPFDLEAVLKYDVEVKLEKTTVLLPGDIDTREYFLAAVRPDWVDFRFAESGWFNITKAS
ncbi:hypothetical protein BDV98DRAFT_430158 [Pterulicium gracile]|uniref:Uncharacterized protein n=1 Tax=Pterulicium gracile TaxID=1884261 RepID=A0A5C3QNV1_9AGAR|nr:hypothetical protein BDV98DRAFT_430158 [Pterula gracilis]